MNSNRSASRSAAPPRGGIGRWLLVAAVLAALALGAYGLWYLFLRPSGPAAVGAPEAPASASTSAPAGSATPTAAGTSAAGSIDGTWNVDTSIGSFSDFSGSWVGYRVQEELAGVGGNVAVGRTPNVSGTLTVQGTEVTAGKITADLTTLQSDDQRRDGQLRRQSIQTGTFPDATFELTSPIDLGSIPADGQTITVQATGNLTLHGQTKQVRVPLQAKRSGAVMTVTGSVPIVFADYGIEKPSSFIVLSVDDHGTMEFQLQFTQA